MSHNSPRIVVDSISRPIALGDELGRGGEGSVFEVVGDPSLVAKIYHKLPLGSDQVRKLHALTSLWSNDLENISAWPRKILFDDVHHQACGLLMLKMEGARPLHELYGTMTRRRHFPDLGWHHLVLAARNVAAAFMSLHSAGIVVGDVNQGNLLIDEKMRVRMIDCDSFQITSGGATFSCPVGSAHFTPPELQGQRLRDIVRTTNHDRFGLATVIFHLLFVGRHPFAGRFRGSGDLSIEKAIAESRFAFSRDRAATQVDPPPASLLLDDLPRGVGDLFERAFRAPVNGQRPTPDEWVQELEQLIKQRQVCKIDPLHVYAAGASRCPWCRIEDVGGPSFFVPADMPTTVSSMRQARLDEMVSQLPQVAFPSLDSRRLALPALPRWKTVRPRPRLTPADFAASSLTVGTLVGLGGGYWSPTIAGAGATLALLSALYLACATEPRRRRATVFAARDQLAKLLEGLQARAQKILSRQRSRQVEFQFPAAELEREKKNYHATGDELVRVIVASRHSQLDDFLRNQTIRDHYHTIAGMTLSHVTLLESFGVESAFDVERIKLYGIPTISESMSINLLQWRAAMERQFRFVPEHGVTLDNLKSIGGATVARYKMMQARKVLMGDDRLKMLADTGKNELVRELSLFDNAVKQWRKAADELRDFQHARRSLERWLNRSVWAVLIPAMLAAAAAVAVFLLR